MSRRKIEETVTEIRKRTIITCDLCGLETKPGQGWPAEGGWSRPDTEVEALIGDVFPEGDFRKRYRLDVCPACFVEKFIPGVEKTFGVKFSESDADDY